MAVIVTGATGFIGGHLVDALSRAGEDVRCLVRHPRGQTHSSATSFVADFRRTDLGVPNSVFSNVDVVYHVAGATRARSAAEFHEANVGVTGRLLDRLEAARCTPRFVYVSSQAAAGPATDLAHPTTERDVAAPIEAYGRSKAEAERLVRSRGDRLSATIVRPVGVYGPNDRDFLAIFRWLKYGLAVYPGIRDAIVTLIQVDDLVRGIIQAGTSPAAGGQTYFMGHPTFVAWREVYQAAAAAMGRSTFREFDVPLAAVRLGGRGGDLFGFVTRRPPLLSSGKAALAAPRFWVCSSERAANEIGFVTPTALGDGMRTTYEWYRRQRWL